MRRVYLNKSYPKCFNSDILNILSNNSSITINGILDQRIDTLWKLKKFIPKGNIGYSPVKKVSYLKNIKNSQLIKNLRIEKTDN